MKRRRFLRDISLGGSGVMIAEHAMSKSRAESVYSYGRISSLEDALTQEGLINVRLEFQSGSSEIIQSSKSKISISKGELARTKDYFFEESEDILDGSEFDISVSNQKRDIIAIWINDATPETMVQIKNRNGKAAFTLQQIVTDPEIVLEIDQLQITVNLLLDREIGELNLSDIKISDPGNEFRIAVLADPQGGDPAEEGNHPTRMKIHNAWVEESIRQTNIVNPLLTLILGDIVDGQGQQRNFIQMADFFKNLESPVLYAIGNHETRYRSVFTPGYNMDAFNNYFDAQKKNERTGIDALFIQPGSMAFCGMAGSFEK
jgi:hypothetical protein